MADNLDLNGPHWPFALRIYRQPGVSDACLLLQDNCGVDVNVLLLNLYAAATGDPRADAERIAEMDAAAARLRDDVVVPLRAIRRVMKTLPEAALGGDFEAVRNKVKAAELDAERLEQAVLARLVRAGEVPSSPDFVAAAGAVVDHYAKATGRPERAATAEARTAIATIAAAAGAPQS